MKNCTEGSQIRSLGTLLQGGQHDQQMRKKSWPLQLLGKLNPNTNAREVLPKVANECRERDIVVRGELKLNTELMKVHQEIKH